MKTYFVKKTYLVGLIVLLAAAFLFGATFHNQIKQLATKTISQNPSIKVTPNQKTTDKQTIKSEKEEIKVPQSNKKEFFIEYRLSRDRNRDRQLELMNEIVNNANSGEDAIREAQKRILNISNNMGKENELEKLIEARGYKDSITLIQDNGITVIVKLPFLTAEDTAKITSTVEQFTGIDREKIVVLAKL